MMHSSHRARRLARLRQELELVRGRIRETCHKLAEDQSDARRMLVTIARLDAQRRKVETVLQVEEILDLGDSDEEPHG